MPRDEAIKEVEDKPNPTLPYPTFMMIDDEGFESRTIFDLARCERGKSPILAG